MAEWEEIERELRLRAPGWWERTAGVLPEVACLAGVPQPARYHGEGDVASHTRLAVEALAPNAEADLLWAALLHDVGKALVTREEEGRVTAHGHDLAGAEAADLALVRLGMPGTRRERIVWLVRNHMFHLSWNLPPSGKPSGRQRRLLGHPRFPLLLELLRADSAASVGHPLGMRNYERYRKLWEELEAARSVPQGEPRRSGCP